MGATMVVAMVAFNYALFYLFDPSQLGWSLLLTFAFNASLGAYLGFRIYRWLNQN